MRSLFFFCIGFVLVAGGQSFASEEPLSADERARRDELRGIAFELVENSLPRISEFLLRNDRGVFEPGETYPVVNTSLALLALMSAGHLPRRGPYQESFRQGVRWLLDLCRKRRSLGEHRSGMISGGSGHSMYGHGFATLALTQLYGQFGGAEDFVSKSHIDTCIRQAVKVIEYAQDPDTGGWSYVPRGGDEGSVTVTQVQALRAARNIGVQVSDEAVAKGIQYLEGSQDKDRESDTYGAVRYTLSASGNHSYTLTAGAMAAFLLFGQYENPAVRRGLERMKKWEPLGISDVGETYPYYSRFYASFAYYQESPNDYFWNTYYPELLVRVGNAAKTGFGNNYGPVYSEALSVLAIAVPLEILPLFQR